FSLARLPPGSSLLPYTTLFRSLAIEVRELEMMLGTLAHEVSERVLQRRDRGEREVLVDFPELRGQRARRDRVARLPAGRVISLADRKSTRLNSSHVKISYAVFC